MGDNEPAERSSWEIDSDAYRRALEETERREAAEGARFPCGKPFPVVWQNTDISPDAPASAQYYTVNDRPVRLLPLPNGGLDAQALNMRTGEFERDLSMLSRCLGGGSDVDQIMDSVTFDSYVSALHLTPRGGS